MWSETPQVFERWQKHSSRDQALQQLLYSKESAVVQEQSAESWDQIKALLFIDSLCLVPSSISAYSCPLTVLGVGAQGASTPPCPPAPAAVRAPPNRMVSNDFALDFQINLIPGASHTHHFLWTGIWGGKDDWAELDFLELGVEISVGGKGRKADGHLLIQAGSGNPAFSPTSCTLKMFTLAWN